MAQSIASSAELGDAVKKLLKDIGRCTRPTSPESDSSSLKLLEQAALLLRQLDAARTEQSGKVSTIQEREQKLAQALMRERERAVTLEAQIVSGALRSPTSVQNGDTQSSPFRTRTQAEGSGLKLRIAQLEAALAEAETEPHTGADPLRPRYASALTAALASMQAVQSALTTGGGANAVPGLQLELSAAIDALALISPSESHQASSMAALPLYSRLCAPSVGGSYMCTQAQYDALLRENASLSSSLLKSRTCITVAVRVRPPRPAEAERDRAAAAAYPGCPTAVVDALTGEEVALWDVARKGWKPYAFDAVHGPTASQSDVFSSASHLAQAVCDGFNAAALAYGITGSGKTYCMTGPPHDPGIGPRLIRRVCALALARPLPPSLRVSVLEVYNEEVRDMLADGGEGGTRRLEVRSGGEDGSVVIPGLTALPASNAEHVLAIFARGLLTRATAPTAIHDSSSRSHCILKLEVGMPAQAGTPWSWDRPTGSIGRLYLVDLAGSERVSKSSVTGARLREAQAINRSLSALGDVMEALDKKAAHVPYRNSALTHVLSDALGGAAKCLLLVCASPGAFGVAETGFSLGFAERARRIDLGPAHKNLQFKSAIESARANAVRTSTAEAAHANALLAVAQLQSENGELRGTVARLREECRECVSDARRALAEKVSSLTVHASMLQTELFAERSARACEGPLLAGLRSVAEEGEGRRREEEGRRVLAEARAAQAVLEVSTLRSELEAERAVCGQLRVEVGYHRERERGQGGGVHVHSHDASTVLPPLPPLPPHPAPVGGPAGSPVSAMQVRQRQVRGQHEAAAAAARRAAVVAEEAARAAILRLSSHAGRTAPVGCTLPLPTLCGLHVHEPVPLLVGANEWVQAEGEEVEGGGGEGMIPYSPFVPSPPLSPSRTMFDAYINPLPTPLPVREGPAPPPVPTPNPGYAPPPSPAKLKWRVLRGYVSDIVAADKAGYDFWTGQVREG